MSFTDAILERSGDCYNICYRSGKLVYEESLIDGMYVASGWNGSGYPLATNSIPNAPRLDITKFPLPQAFRVVFNGEYLGYRWEWDNFTKEQVPKGLLITVSLYNPHAMVKIRIYTLLDGTPVFTRWLEIENLKKEKGLLSALSLIGGGMQSIRNWKSYVEKDEPLYRLGYMEHTHQLMEGGFKWHPLPNAGYTVSGRFMRDRHRHPIFILENLATGESFICQLGYSGGYSFGFELEAEEGIYKRSNESHLSYSVSLDGPAPLRIADPGETITTPEVHMGISFGGLDACVNAMHEHLRKSVFLPPALGKKCFVEAAIGPEFDMSRESTLESIENASKIGAEIYFVDAGWYAPPKGEDSWWGLVGDWEYDKERYPDGLDEIRRAVKEKGMLFGLWMDAERIGNSSKAYQEHRDLIGINYDNRECPSQMLNLADPRAAEWMEAQIEKVIRENKCDFFRLDYNTGRPSYITRTDRDGVLENDFMRYYEALYAIYGRLRKKFPDVVFENCASGGGRTDVGMVKHFAHTWVTDNPISPRSFAIMNGMTMALPPEYVDRMIGGQHAYLAGSFDCQVRQLLFVRPTVGISPPVGERMNPELLEFLRHSLDIYKNFVRLFLPDSDIFHHTPDSGELQPKGFGIIEAAAKDGSRGMLGVFQLASPKEREIVVYPRGVDVSRSYDVTFDNSRRVCRVEGYALKNGGIHIRLDGALTSELILYKEITPQ